MSPIFPAPTDAERALDALADTQPELAAQFRAGWDTPAGAWVASQWDPPASPGFEPAFRSALVHELALRDDLDAAAADALVAEIEAGGAVITSHHVCPTPGPTFGGIDRLATLGHDGPILVLAWSGVPMSNSAWSGALCFSAADYGDLLREGTPELKRQRQAAKDRARDGITGEQRLSLVPAALRDALLFECPLPDRLHEVFAAATPALQALLPAPVAHERYPTWAIRAAQAMERQVLGRDDLHYVDLNRVGARYVLEVLDTPEHPVTRLLGDDGVGVTGVDGLSWFYGRRPGKREKVLTHDATPDAVREGLASGQLCPGLVPIFGALRLLSRIRLLGGFRQVLYLETIAAAWQRAGLVDADRGVPGHLMTGRLTAGGAPLYPLDLALGKAPLAALPTASTPMSALWTPLIARVRATT